MHSWTTEQVEALKEIFNNLKASKATGSIPKLAATRFNEKFPTNLSKISIKRKYSDLINTMNKDRQSKSVKWTPEAKEVLFKNIIIYVLTKSQQLKREFFSEMAKIIGTSGNACVTKLQPVHWFSTVELQLLETAWPDEKKKMLVAIIQAESSLEQGYQAAAKNLQTEVWICKARFEDIIIREFMEMGNKRRGHVKNLLDKQKSSSPQLSGTTKKRKTPPMKLEEEDVETVESLFLMSKSAP